MRTDTVFLNFETTDFVSVKAGEPYRLLPLGRIFRGGRFIDVTKELLSKFRLPHFRPPIKLGSHNDETPAGGHIVGLEVREDGLYAVPEYTDTGINSLFRGDYRYHSPEIIWEGGSLENPTDGSRIEGPLIVGDALLHTPHLGEATALYEISVHGGATMTETVTVPLTWFDRLLGRQEPDTQMEPVATPKPQDNKPDEFAAKFEAEAAKVERLTAQIAEMEAEKARAGRVSHFAAAFAETPLTDDTELHELLANVDDKTAGALVIKFRALAEQAKHANLTADLGSHGDSGVNAGVAKYQAAVDELVKTGMERGKAAQYVAENHPEYLEAN